MKFIHIALAFLALSQSAFAGVEVVTWVDNNPDVTPASKVVYDFNKGDLPIHQTSSGNGGYGSYYYDGASIRIFGSQNNGHVNVYSYAKDSIYFDARTKFGDIVKAGTNLKVTWQTYLSAKDPTSSCSISTAGNIGAAVCSYAASSVLWRLGDGEAITQTVDISNVNSPHEFIEVTGINHQQVSRDWRGAFTITSTVKNGTWNDVLTEVTGHSHSYELPGWNGSFIDRSGSFDMGSSVYWGGIQSVTLMDGTPLDFSVSSSSGIDYAVSYIPASAVPEPETYAMMLAGLGLVGGAVKRRSKSLG